MAPEDAALAGGQLGMDQFFEEFHDRNPAIWLKKNRDSTDPKRVLHRPARESGTAKNALLQNLKRALE
ncbi:hypothetical protein GCM10011362_05700 [Marinobacter halophilus]|nr:hypothetical protein GCM10011362_05700 [Marinobacter halophilus]